eukprot:gene2447-2889_t
MVASSHRSRLVGFVEAAVQTHGVAATVVHAEIDGALKYDFMRGGLEAYLVANATLIAGFTSAVESGYNIRLAWSYLIVLLNTWYTQPPWGLFQMLGRNRPSYCHRREIVIFPGRDVVDFDAPAVGGVLPPAPRRRDGGPLPSFADAMRIVENPLRLENAQTLLAPAFLDAPLTRVSPSGLMYVDDRTGLHRVLAHI